MKHLIICLFIFFNNFLIFSQNKETCNNKNSILNDLNKLEKCKVKVKRIVKKNSDTELSISYRRRIRRDQEIKRRIKKNEEAIDLLDAVSQSGLETISQEIKTENIDGIKEVLFSVVEEAPLFPDCISSERKDQKECFNVEFSKHFANNFNPERAADDAVKGRVFIQFSITQEGDLTQLVIKSTSKSKLLEKEVERVISKLPKFVPGKQNGTAVSVKYGIPINLNIE